MQHLYIESAITLSDTLTPRPITIPSSPLPPSPPGPNVPRYDVSVH